MSAPNFQRIQPLWSCVFFLLGVGCSHQEEAGSNSTHGASSSEPAISSLGASSPPEAPIPSASQSPKGEPLASGAAPSAAPSAAAGSSVATSPEPPRSLPEKWVLDELVDIGPAGPATATQQGVVLISRDNQTHLAKYTPASGRQPAPTRLSELNLSAEQLVAQRKGPAIAGDYAYWVDENFLYRKNYRKTSELEPLARDARHSTRVATLGAPRPGEPAMAAYIAHSNSKDTPLKAKIWVENQGLAEVSPEASTANSVGLMRHENRPLILSLEARAAMSTLHGRPLRIQAGEASLAPSEVFWVGGPSNPYTEIILNQDSALPFGFLTMERSGSSFGLVAVQFHTEKNKTEISSYFMEYPNGIDPAPVAAATICRQPVVLYARPATSAARSTQELRLGLVHASGITEADAIAHSRAFANISIHGDTKGALVTYTADRRTWARAIRCPN